MARVTFVLEDAAEDSLSPVIVVMEGDSYFDPLDPDNASLTSAQRIAIKLLKTVAANGNLQSMKVERLTASAGTGTVN
jgi:hypothetical protein